MNSQKERLTCIKGKNFKHSHDLRFSPTNCKKGKTHLHHKLIKNKPVAIISLIILIIFKKFYNSSYYFVPPKPIQVAISMIEIENEAKH